MNHYNSYHITITLGYSSGMCTLAVTNISIDQDLRPGQQKGHHA